MTRQAREWVEQQWDYDQSTTAYGNGGRSEAAKKTLEGLQNESERKKQGREEWGG
jgi:hypothetical protein